MKKLLSVLAAVGLTATASTAVVACTTTIKAKNMDVTPDKTTGTPATYTIATKDSEKVTLTTGVTKDIAANTDVKGADLATDFGKMVFAGKDGKKLDMGGTPSALTVTVVKAMKKGDKKATIKFSMTISLDQADKLGLVDKKTGKAGKDLKVKLGSAKADGNLDKVVLEFTVSASKFAFTPAA